MMRQTRARMEGRAGPGIGQPWRDLRKLLRKQPIRPRGTTEAFRFAPLVLVATCLVVAAAAPFVSTASTLDPIADLFAIVAVLTLGTVAMALAGIDTGTAFGGMGASRESTIVALVEPTLLVAIFALSVPVGSTNLGAIVTAGLDDPAGVFSPVSLLAAAALVVVIVAETGPTAGGQPVHPSRVDDGARGDGAGVRRTGPGGDRTGVVDAAGGVPRPAGQPVRALGHRDVGRSAGAAGRRWCVRGQGRAARRARWRPAEVFLAKLRLFRVPELLAGSFVLGLLAVSASFVLS